VRLPNGVHRVKSKGKEYFYWQPHRGTPFEGERVPLPSDPHSPEFWQQLRHCQGLPAAGATSTIGGMIDTYMASPVFLQLAAGSQYQYRRSLDIARKAWGPLPSSGLRPVHVQAVVDGMAGTPAKANMFLCAVQALSKWARARDYIEQSLTEGVDRYEIEGGHMPWSPAQIRAAHEHLTGNVRKGIILMLYTGQRGSDVVRLGAEHVVLFDDGKSGFDLRQIKTDRDVICPILPELETEMAMWERRPGPYLQQASGKPYSRILFWEHWDAARKAIPELSGPGVKPHGLRASAVIRLRRAGLSELQIADTIGMSPAMVKRYCRFASREENARAVMATLSRNTALL
jgi:integrase